VRYSRRCLHAIPTFIVDELAYLASGVSAGFTYSGSHEH
jgi:hypothetical protein